LMVNQTAMEWHRLIFSASYLGDYGQTGPK